MCCAIKIGQRTTDGKSFSTVERALGPPVLLPITMTSGTGPEESSSSLAIDGGEESEADRLERPRASTSGTSSAASLSTASAILAAVGFAMQAAAPSARARTVASAPSLV